MAGTTDDALLVVGIGASAGGIQALSTFFKDVPPDKPIAYVVILHLSPAHESMLAQVLQACTTLPVTQVQGKIPIEPGHIYVIPPGETLEASDGSLVLSTRVPTPSRRKAAVDVFFRTLAERYGPRAVGVVLSGTGADGASGLKRVKESGGLTIAQLPTEAAYADMPANAIATNLVDYVLPIDEMPQRIVEYEERSRHLGAVLGPPAADIDDTESLRDVMTMLRLRTGHDFSNYKPGTARRRVVRRMTVAGLQSVAEYARLLDEQPDEATALMKELLISVTGFFRDPEVFALLSTRVIPRLFEGKGHGDQLRAWSVGCATGEEAYSLAMLLVEHASIRANAPAIQVFATDLDDDAIAVAREGLYTEGDVVDIPPERLQRFFIQEAGGYRVRRELREVVLFAVHNVIKDPPFSHLDLIACRNLLIYLNRNMQARVVGTFHFALRPRGVLVLGSSESLDSRPASFLPLENDARVYESIPIANRLPSSLIDRSTPQAALLPRLPEWRAAERLWPGELHLRLLEQFAPPSVIVTDDHTVVHMSERAGRFFQMPGGEPTRDLMKLVHPDLRDPLRQAMLAASQKRQPIEVRGARMEQGGAATLVNVTVKPVLRDNGGARGYLLILLEEAGAAPLEPPPIALSGPLPVESKQLEEEFARTREELRATIEQYETEAEEARASNEELQSMNEELRSAAEELETSQEELQSVNEELTTVNEELKIKIEQLGVTNNDFQNLISSADIGAIFIDKLMNVKLTTPRASDLFNLLPTDIGRRLSDITCNFDYPDLQHDVSSVLARLRTVEREVATRDGRWYLLRLVPYRTLDDRIEGVALAFQDITSRHHAEQEVRDSEERLRMLVDSATDYAMFTLKPDGIVDSWNAGGERLYGYATPEIVGRPHDVLFTPEDRAAGIPAQVLERTRTNHRTTDERWHVRKDGSRFYASNTATMLDHPALGFASIARDLTRQRDAAAALDEANATLELRVQQRTAELEAEIARHAAAQERVTALLRKVVTAQEDERTRIARELHDQLGQQLTALRLTLERYRARCTPSALAEEVDRVLAIVGEIDRAVDFLAWELRPATLDHLGLGAALPRFVDEWSAHVGIAAKFQSVGTLNGLLPPDAEIAFYRIAQEALNNVSKHAHASRVDVILEVRDSSVVMVIEDDGVGFDPADRQVTERGLGISGMRERAVLIAATLEIESAPGKGTAVYVRCPVGAGAQAKA